MNAILGQSNDMPLFYQALREQFNRGGTFGSVLITLGGFALLILVVAVLTRFDQRRRVIPEPDHSARVFREALQKLGVPPSQQRVFEAMAGETKARHPAALLLSEKLYDQHVAQWHSNRGARAGDPDHAILIKARTRLFPSGTGWISSGPEQV